MPVVVMPPASRATPKSMIFAGRPRGIEAVRERNPDMGVVLITHYQRLLDEVTPDAVHIMVDGRIVRSGGIELAHTLETEGYETYRGAEVGA